MIYTLTKRTTLSPEEIAALLGVTGMSGPPSLSVQKDGNGNLVVTIEFPGKTLSSTQVSKLNVLAAKLGWGE